jgi:integrase|tara:strand:+ start:229 stop:615 length:387 start_codon:yes stop_codon:yes gene_type:complete
LPPAKIAEYRDLRLKEVAPGTVVRELAYLSSIINHGRREWGIHANNPVALVRKPTQPKGRERVLSLAERERLLAELQPTGRRNTWMPSAVILALETAMRRTPSGSALNAIQQPSDTNNQAKKIPLQVR